MSERDGLLLAAEHPGHLPNGSVAYAGACPLCNPPGAALSDDGALDVERLNRAVHAVFCRGRAPMHSAPDHSAERLAAAYREARQSGGQER